MIGSITSGVGVYLLDPTLDVEENAIRFGMGAVMGLFLLSGTVERLVVERRLPIRTKANMTIGQLSIFFRLPGYAKKVHQVATEQKLD